jgi:hypothetical protein
MATETVGVLDRMVDVLGVQVPLRQFGKMTRVERAAFAWHCMVAALRRRWAAPNLDFLVDTFDVHTIPELHFLWYSTLGLVNSAFYVNCGQLEELGEIDVHTRMCAERLASLPQTVVFTKFCPVIPATQWHCEPRLPPVRVTPSMVSVAWKQSVVADAAFLLGGDLSHIAVGRLYKELTDRSVLMPLSVKLWERAARAVWNCVRLERMPLVETAVASVLPVRLLPELVVGYTFGASGHE